MFKAGDKVHLKPDYYHDHKISFRELPRFNWTVQSIEGDLISIKYDRPNKPYRGMLVDRKYLTDSIV